MPRNRSKGKERKLKPKLRIFCEGEKTEPNYLNGYIESIFPKNKLIKVEENSKNTPIQLVEIAIKAKNDASSPEGDVFWVVFDRESENKYLDSLHNKAFQDAKNNDINIALSNVCFELWILLHFPNNAAHYQSYDDLINRSDLRKKHIKNYDKGNKKIFDTIEKLIPDARKNAIVMNANTEKSANPNWRSPYQWNPYTDVYKLLDAIDDFVANN